jgi:hypothetical protein
MVTAVAFPDDSSDGEPSGIADSQHTTGSRQLLAVPDLAGFTELRMWAECYDDAQKARIACSNRMTIGGLPPEVFEAQLATLVAAEHQFKLALGRCYRRTVPAGVREWQTGTFGIGAHLLARLIGALGHPRIATPFHWEGEGDKRTLVADEVFERSVRQLWTYCGHGEALKRRKGMTAEDAFGLGSPRCKMLVHLLAEASIKCRVEPSASAFSSGRPADPASSPQPSSRESSAMHDTAVADLSPDQSTSEASASRGSADRDSSPHQSTGPSASIVHPAGVDSSPDPSIGLTPAKPRSVGRDSSAGQPGSVTGAMSGAADRRYRYLYEARRAHTAGTHPEWTLGHSHNDALRIVGKRILADLWEAAG